jgi:fatty acid kinase
VTDLERVREIANAALASLEANRRRIDDLNVYPVPDGDTGTNLTLTGRAIVDALRESRASDRETIAREVTRAALMGGRGNSGVIFSQIVRGAAEVLGHADAIDEDVLTHAFRAASDAAYRAVRQPVEGTMLSAIRALAEEAERGPADFWPAVVRAGDEAVVRTQQQLDVLRAAGVIDAGAAGLIEVVRGIAAAVTGEEIEEPAELSEPLTVEAIHHELSRYRYCTTFVIEGDGLDADALERKLERLGDSLLVVGDENALKVHVHTDDPGAALSLGTAAGVIERIEIANMHEQTHEREERLLHPVADLPASAVVAVVAGDGNKKLFESFGATVVEGGQSMNPSVGDLARRIADGRAHAVIVLPNNSNVIAAAENAARHADVEAHLLPTRSIQEGLSAMVAFDAARSADENLAEMQEVLSAVATGEVTTASRDAHLNGLSIRAGEYLGLADGAPVATGPDFDEVAAAVTERLLAEPRGVLTLLTGAEEPQLDALIALLRQRHPDLEVDVQQGGQPHYPLLLSAE